MKYLSKRDEIGLQQLFTIREVAESTKLSEAALRLWISRRKLAVVRLGRRVRISRAEVERLIADGTVPALLS